MTKTDLFQTCDVVFLSYDEPAKEEAFEHLKKVIPKAQRIDGVKGLDKAHRACAEIGTKSRVLIIDGDNKLLVNELKVSQELFKGPYVLSFLSRNSINNLQYGNGGIKCWPRELLKTAKGHEESSSRVDFLYETPYFQTGVFASVSEIHRTAAQAFRAAFREGLKMALVNGKTFSRQIAFEKKLDQLLPTTGLYRLRTWCQVGIDVENGIYALWGARRGLAHLLLDEGAPEVINDYDWLNSLTHKLLTDQSKDIDQKILELGHKLGPFFKEPLNAYNSLESELFKSAMIMPQEIGPIQKAREFFNE